MTLIDGEQELHPPPVDAVVHQSNTDPQGPRRGRKGKGEAFYARVARTYVTEIDEGRIVGMLEQIRKRHRLANINQARTAVYRAREMGLLGARQAGKISGLLTNKAKAVLASLPPKRKPGTKVRPSRRPQRSKAEG